MNKELIDYIKQSIHQGYSIDQIEESMINAGYAKPEIDKAIYSATNEPKPRGASKKIWIIPVLVIILVMVLIFGFLFVYKNFIGQQTNSFVLDEQQQDNGPQLYVPPDIEPRTEPTAQPEATSGKCGTDLDCFILYSETCFPSSVTYGFAVDVFGMIQNSTDYIEIRDIQDARCVFYIEVKNVDVVFSDELVQRMLDGGSTIDQIRLQEETAKSQSEILVGKDGECRFPAGELPAMLKRWRDGNFSSEDWAVADCEGSFFTGIQ